MKIKKLVCILLSVSMVAMCSCFSASALVSNTYTASTSSIKAALQSDNWDFVTYQQASPNSGQYNTYFPYLTNLMNYVAQYAPNATPVLHQTWAYQVGSWNGGFANYGNDQVTMYNAIIDANKRAAETAGIDIILPDGEAWQTVRGTAVGDTLTRDTYHGNEKGQYINAAVWYEMLTGHSILENSFNPVEIPANELAIIKQVVHDTVAKYRDPAAPVLNKLKVLSIGNSFSDDAHKYIPMISKADDVEFTVANLYIGGCSLATHWSNASSDASAYDYKLFSSYTTDGMYFANMPFTSNSGATYYTQKDKVPSCSLVCMLPTDQNYNGAYVEFDVGGLAAGSYSISIASRGFTSRGIYQMSINGENISNPIDFYQAGSDTGFDVRENVGTVTLNDSNDFKLRFTCTGKYNSASGYSLYLGYIVFTPLDPPYATDGNYAYGVSSNNFSDVVAAFGNGAKIYNGAAEITEGKVGTGMRIVTNSGEYEYIHFGDLNGDGNINASDLLTLKMKLLALNSLSGAKIKAANVNRDAAGEINASDLLLLKRYLLGLQSISQK